MNEYEVYLLYVAIRSHFLDQRYDFFKYQGKTKASVDSYERRRDKDQFKKLAKHRDPQGFILANFIERTTFVAELAYDKDSLKRYRAWKNRVQSLTYRFKNEIAALKPDLGSNFIAPKGEHPEIIKLYMRKEISIETLTIILDLLGIHDVFKRKLNGDPLWSWLGSRTRKYAPFLQTAYDPPKFKEILLAQFQRGNE